MLVCHLLPQRLGGVCALPGARPSPVQSSGGFVCPKKWGEAGDGGGDGVGLVLPRGQLGWMLRLQLDAEAHRDAHLPICPTHGCQPHSCLPWPRLDGVSILGFPSIPTCQDLTLMSAVMAKPKRLQRCQGSSMAEDMGVRGVGKALPLWPALAAGMLFTGHENKMCIFRWFEWQSRKEEFC